MAIDPGEALIARLASDLAPVQRRRWQRDVAVLLVLGVIEAMLFVALRGMRPDMPMAMGRMAFWWKVASLGILVAIGAATALRTFAPTASPRPGLRRFAIAAVIALMLGWMIDAARGGGATLLTRLDWRGGLACVAAVVVLSIPALIAFGMLIRRGAATDPGGTALAAGATASAWGGLVFVMRCPHDDPLYVAVWFAVSIILVSGLARLLLPRLARW